MNELINQDTVIKSCPVCYSVNLIYNPAEHSYKCKNCRNIIQKSNFNNDNFFIKLIMAEESRQMGEFDNSERISNDILSEYGNENVDLKLVYWNKFLCNERIVYRKLNENFTIPNFYELLSDNDTNYQNVLSLCQTHDEMQVYQEQYQLIHTIKDNYFNLFNSDKIKPYDIFISFKASTDINLAYRIYNRFGKDYNIFFSPVSLNNISSGAEYSSNILYGLKTAKILILICSSSDYLNEGWVADEWKNFSRQMLYDKSNSKTIIPVLVDDFKENYLPRELATAQWVRNDESMIDNLNSRIDTLLSKKQPVQVVENEKKTNVKQKKKKKKMNPLFLLPFILILTTFALVFANFFSGGEVVNFIKGERTHDHLRYTIKNNSVTIIGVTDNDVETIKIPKVIRDRQVVNINQGIFSDCKKLNTLTLPFLTNSNNTIKTLGYFFGTEKKDGFYLAKQNNTDYYIPSSLTTITILSAESIPDYYFQDCECIQNITLPSDLVKIGNSAFQSCSITSITVPKTVTTIGDRAFYESSLKTFLTTEEGITLIENIGEECFAHTNLTYFTLPPLVTTIKKSTFSSCFYLSDFYFYDVLEIESILQYFSLNDDKYKTKTGLETIEDGAFSDCLKLKTIYLPNTLKVISNNVFDCCSNLNYIYFEHDSKLEKIGQSAFNYCKLEFIELPSTLKYIGSNAFSNCTKLCSVSFENTSGWVVNDVELDLSNVDKNATYLTTTYLSYDWNKS